MDIYTVIATSGRQKLLEETLVSLRSAAKPVSYKGVFVIENGGNRSVEKLVTGFKADFPVRYRYIPESNKSLALNTVIKEIPSGLVYFNDDDVCLEEQALIAIAEAAGSIAAPCFLGGPLGQKYESQLSSEVREFIPYKHGWRYPSDVVCEVHAPCFFGANWAVRAEDVRSAGGFSHRLGPSCLADGEETELQMRLLAAGIKGYYVPAAKVWHVSPPEQKELGWLLNQQFRRGYTKQLFMNVPPAVRGVLILRFIGCALRSYARVCRNALRINHAAFFRSRSELHSNIGRLCGLLWGKLR